MKIIHKSILKELLYTLLITLAFLNSILMMEKLLRLSRLLSGVGASLTDMVKMIIYIQPQLLALTIPMSMLLAILIVYGRMNIDSELIVMRSSGMDFRSILTPVAILGIACFIASITVSFYIGPKSSTKMREQMTQIISTRSILSVEEGVFNTSFKDIVIIVKGKKSDDILENIFIYDNRSKDEPKVLMAKQGQFFMQDSMNIGLFLKDGYINITKGTGTTEMYFEKYRMSLNISAESPAPKKMEFSPLELLRKAKEADTDKKQSALYLEFHRRLSLPVVCLILIFLGPPLAHLSGRSGRLGGLAIGLFVFTAYYMLLIYGENLVMAMKLPHYAGAWMSSIILAIFSTIMFRREAKR